MLERRSEVLPSGGEPARGRILRMNDLDHDALDAAFVESWKLHERLFSSIVDERRYFVRADPLRHPLVFYFAHPAAFYVEKLRIAGLLRGPVRLGYDVLFARGVDPEAPEDLPRRRNWPSLEALHRYRDDVRDAVRDAIARCPLPPRVGPEHPAWAVVMGIEHERIHVETTSMLLRQVPVHALSRPTGFDPADVRGRGAPSGFVEIPTGDVVLGKPDSSTTFGWDDELGEKPARVRAFRAGRNLVTNREFLAFVEDGGYARSDLWTREGWRWRTASRARAPRFWEPSEHGLRYRATFELLPFPASWPVEVTCHEAEAYCRWLGEGHRLPTELEWGRLLRVAPRATDEDGARFNLHLRFGSPTPVGAMDPDDAPVRDVRGNVWQWLGDDFAPLPGFAPHPLYPDFSVPFFGPRHATLRGGSWATTGAAASPWYRLWFRRHFHQHAGFRVVRPLS